MTYSQETRRFRAMIGAIALGLLEAAFTTAPATAQTSMAQTAKADVEGVWFDQSGRAGVEIAPCGTRLCGYIYWVREVIYPDGRPVIDKLNPDPRRRNKPICGTRILADLAPEGRTWAGGKIYDPEEGENFDVEISLISPNKLNVLGFAGLKIFGETYVWTRAPADLPRCGPARV